MRRNKRKRFVNPDLLGHSCQCTDLWSFDPFASEHNSTRNSKRDKPTFGHSPPGTASFLRDAFAPASSATSHKVTQELESRLNIDTGHTELGSDSLIRRNSSDLDVAPQNSLEKDHPRKVLLEYELDNLVKKHAETVQASFYLDLQSKLLFDETAGVNLVLRMLAALLCIWLQQFALHTVSGVLFLKYQYGTSKDVSVREAAFPAGVPYPTDFKFMLSSLFEGKPPHGSVNDVPLITIFPMVFCVFAVVLVIYDELEELKIGYLLVRNIAKLNSSSSIPDALTKSIVVPPRTRDLESGTQDEDNEQSESHLGWWPPAYFTENVERWGRWVGAWTISICRFCLMLKFISTTMQLLGTSDGPVDVILNSLALSFILEFDNSAALVFSVNGPSQHSFFGLLAAGRRAPGIYNRRPSSLYGEDDQKLRNVLFWMLSSAGNSNRLAVAAYIYTERLKPLAYAVLIFNVAFRMQRYTSSARFVTVDDDFIPHQQSITMHYNWTLYVVGFFQATSLHVAWLVCLPPKNIKDAAKQVLELFFELALLIVVYEVVFRYANDTLIHESSKLDFWQQISPMPRRGSRHEADPAIRMR